MNNLKNYITFLLLLLPLILGGCFCFGGPGCEPTNPCDYYCPCTDGKTPMSNIARWDGTQWLPLGSGVNGKINRIVVDSVAGELYVFGSFTSAGGIPVNGQAKWSEKKQLWSVTGTNLPVESATCFYPTCVASDGKVYLCNFVDNRLYNSDGSYLAVNGICVWDGNRWETLLKLMDLNYYCPSVLKIVDSKLYFIAQVFPGKQDNPSLYIYNHNLYVYDLLTNKIIDSLPDDSPIRNSHFQDPLNYIAVSSQGIFIDEGDGVYRYDSGIRSKLIQFDTVYKDRFNELSIGSDYFSTGLKVRKSKNEEGGLNFYIYDIKADSTIYLTINSLNALAHPFVSGHTLFVGGAFYLKDGGSADVRNIGAYDLREKKWYDLAGGVCGPVHAIAEMNGSMYVGGEFSTVGKK